MYKTRILPAEEWHKLDGEPGKACQAFDKEHTNVMVVEKDEVIVGSWSLMPFYHAECVWIAEAFRGNPVVAGRLITGMKRMAKEVGVKSIITSALDNRTEKLLEHLKADELPGKHYVLHL